jgi:hypothetical protein
MTTSRSSGKQVTVAAPGFHIWSVRNEGGAWTMLALFSEPSSTLVNLATVARGVQEALESVDDVRVAAGYVRQTSALDKLLCEAMKTWRSLDRCQFALRQDVAESHLRTQRRAGELLTTLPKHTGGRRRATSRVDDEPIPSTLEELGIDAHESHRWQLIAALPQEVFEDFILECRETEQELTSARALNLARRLRTGRLMERPSGRLALLREYERICADVSVIVQTDAAGLYDAVASDRRRKELEQVRSLRLWIQELGQALRTTPFVSAR